MRIENLQGTPDWPPLSTYVAVKLPAAVLAALKERARRDGVTMAEAQRRAIAAYVGLEHLRKTHGSAKTNAAGITPAALHTSIREEEGARSG